MILNLTVQAVDKATEKEWTRELANATFGMPEVAVFAGSAPAESSQIVFLVGTSTEVDQMLTSLTRKGKAVFLIVRDSDPVPTAFLEGKVDDILVYPFRPLEIVSKLSRYRQILMWEEVSHMNTSFQQLLEGLKEDLQLAERLQKGKLPVRFPDIKGFKVTSRYLAGLRSGGDYFDIADSRDGSRFSIMMSDSSSYGLCSSVMSVLMKVAMKLSIEEVRSSADTVRSIYRELAMTLNEKDRFSLFYGVVSRKDLSLKYLNLGTSCAFYSPKDEPFRELSSQGAPLTRSSGFPTGSLEVEMALQPDDRLALISDGFVEAAGGAREVCALLDRFRKNEAVDSVNELVYRVKGKFTNPDEDMPEQDCTVMVFDVDSRVIRLASR